MTMRGAIGPATILLAAALLSAGVPAVAAAETAADSVPSAADRTPAMAAAAARVTAAGAALTAAEAAPDPVPALAAALPVYQAALSDLRAAVNEAGDRAQALTVDLNARQDAVARLLGALEAMGRTPPPVPALHPEGPIGAARAEALLERLRPALQDETQRLAGRLAAQAAALRQHAAGEADLAGALVALNTGQQALAAALGGPEEDVVPQQSAALTMLARDSETLSQLAAALAGAPGAPPPPQQAAQEPMLWPVQGAIARHFNEPDAAGARRPGVVLAAAPLAIVSSPADAVVRYAGPFLEYGTVVVLAPDAGTMLVLAGLSRVRVRTGDSVHRGEFLGLLGGRALDVEEYVMLPTADTGAGGGETLYIELRRGQGPVDPEPLFGGNG